MSPSSCTSPVHVEHRELLRCPVAGWSPWWGWMWNRRAGLCLDFTSSSFYSHSLVRKSTFIESVEQTGLWELLTNRIRKHATLKALCKTSIEENLVFMFVCKCFKKYSQFVSTQFLVSERWAAISPCYWKSSTIILKFMWKNSQCVHMLRAPAKGKLKRLKFAVL